uniref:Peptidase M1 leukotriene A4 hydrolase/aminopeptidase C-terminal domain-containing protein n=1 Tax=Parascaris equorum TaxID=6256 RepID=A0A914RSN2_PAREQ
MQHYKRHCLFILSYDGHLLREAASLARRWMDANDTDLSKFTSAEFRSLSSPLQIKVLDIIYAGVPLPKLKVARLDEVYNLTATDQRISFISIRRIARSCKYDCGNAANISCFLYRYRQQCLIERLGCFFPVSMAMDLFLWTESAAEAIAQFRKSAPFMHPICVSLIEKLIPK